MGQMPSALIWPPQILGRGSLFAFSGSPGRHRLRSWQETSGRFWRVALGRRASGWLEKSQNSQPFPPGRAAGLAVSWDIFSTLELLSNLPVTPPFPLPLSSSRKCSFLIRVKIVARSAEVPFVPNPSIRSFIALLMKNPEWLRFAVISPPFLLASVVARIFMFNCTFVNSSSLSLLSDRAESISSHLRSR